MIYLSQPKQNKQSKLNKRVISAYTEALLRAASDTVLSGKRVISAYTTANLRAASDVRQAEFNLSATGKKAQKKPHEVYSLATNFMQLRNKTTRLLTREVLLYLNIAQKPSLVKPQF